MTDSERTTFQKTVRDYYHKHGRHDLPWRIAESDSSFDPYKILVSELMLQQTQVARVIPKFNDFIAVFPTVPSLAAASLGEVLKAWSGLGYNRRAKFLHQSAQRIVNEYNGIFPTTVAELITLPGVGTNTAGAVAAYAFNQPVVFIETNIRTVYIYHYFRGQTEVSDTAIKVLVEETLDVKNPRLFYWGLMDYGTHLKQSVGNLARASKHYTKQSAFEGSRRQVRGAIIRLLGVGNLSYRELATSIADERLADVLKDLLGEGMISIKGKKYELK